MARYFFHTDDGRRVVDAIGTELSNDAKAYREAVRLAGAMMADDPNLLFGGRVFRTEVCAAGGQPLFTIVAQAASASVPQAD